MQYPHWLALWHTLSSLYDDLPAARPRLHNARSLRNTSDASVFNSAARRARAEKGKMTELTRYLVRKGSTGWMVWDRLARVPARLEGGRPAVGLTEEQAREIKDELTKESF